MGDPGGALQIVSSRDLSVLTGSHDNKTYLSIWSVPGEVWCATSRQNDGLISLMTWINAVAPHVSEGDPGVARVRAVAGLCALAVGQRADAARLANLARGAFVRQNAVSPYYKAPLFKLERALGLHLPPI